MAKKFIRLGPGSAAFDLASSEDVEDVANQFSAGLTFPVETATGATIIINSSATPWLMVGED